MTYEQKLKWRAALQFIIPISVLIVITAVAVIVFSSAKAPDAQPMPSQAELVVSFQQKVWLHALAWCESRGVRGAINPKDTDGRQKFGLLQFDIATLPAYRLKYNLPPADIMDYKAQIETALLMINDPEVNPRKEWPACVRKIGPPPRL
jgi:hypothetical protein